MRKFPSPSEKRGCHTYPPLAEESDTHVVLKRVSSELLNGWSHEEKGGLRPPPPDLLRAFPECVGTPANTTKPGPFAAASSTGRSPPSVGARREAGAERKLQTSTTCSLEEAQAWTTLSLEPGGFFLGLENPPLRSSPSIINGVQSYLSNAHGWSGRARGS